MKLIVFRMLPRIQLFFGIGSISRAGANCSKGRLDPAPRGPHAKSTRPRQRFWGPGRLLGLWARQVEYAQRDLPMRVGEPQSWSDAGHGPTYGKLLCEAPKTKEARVRGFGAVLRSFNSGNLTKKSLDDQRIYTPGGKIGYFHHNLVFLKTAAFGEKRLSN